MKKEPQLMSYEDFQALFPEGVSGNDVNGLGVAEKGPPQPFFWHPPDKQPFHELQKAVIDYQRQIPALAASFSRDAPRGPRPIPQASEIQERAPHEWSRAIKTFGMQHEADLIGITPLQPEYIYEGYDIQLPNLIMIGVAMDYEKLSQAPSSPEHHVSALEVADKYNNAARAAREIGNMILAAGYAMKTFPGPMATALNMIPAAIAAGLGELGKHGSMINREYGSNFRLSAVATDMPLAFDSPDDFGADGFCMSCQICSRVCPPDAIADEKQMVRGNVKWYVDFDKCIPYFGEAMSCGICIAKCPWSNPGTAPRLAEKLTRKRERENTD